MLVLKCKKSLKQFLQFVSQSLKNTPYLCQCLKYLIYLEDHPIGLDKLIEMSCLPKMFYTHIKPIGSLIKGAKRYSE